MQIRTIIAALLISVSGITVQIANADENGTPSLTPFSCSASAFSTFDFICSTLGLPCKMTANSCADGKQEIFTGATLELASPTNWKSWTGFGAMGEIYQVAGACLLRDLKDGAMTSSATASTFIGDVSIKQDVSFLAFDQKSRRFDGLHHSKVCVPVVGCFDAFYQNFSLVPVATNLKGSGKKIGDYDAYGTFGWELQTQAENQALNVTIPAITIDTPYGDISAKPEFGFGRAFGAILAPYNGGNMKSSISSLVGIAKVTDLYGRNPGLTASQQFPFQVVTGSAVVDYSKIGWESQFALGSRDANPKGVSWSPPAGVTFPDRPDSDLGQARNVAEKSPNVFAGADVRVEYSPTDMIPDWIRNSGFITFNFDVFATPSVGAAFTSQFDLINGEISKWTGAKSPAGAPLYTPDQLDQVKTLSMTGATSAAARFALDAGVDLTIHLHVPLVFTSIDEDLIDIHPTTTIAEKISKSGTNMTTKNASVLSQGSKILATKNLFQQYDTFNGPKDGWTHIKACVAKPTAPGSMPAPPTYQEGNPADLLKGIEYPCNICVGMNDKTYTDKDGVAHTIKGFLTSYFPADEGTRPPGVRWTCDHVYETGCYDMCSWDPNTKKLTVIETARELIAKGEAKKMPGRCR